jgi:hypothetical protein
MQIAVSAGRKHKNEWIRQMTKTTANPPDKEITLSQSQAPARRYEPLPCKEGGSLPAPTDLTPEQAQAYEDMNDPLRQKALEMRALMGSQVKHQLESEYELGSLVLEIHDNPGTYGATSDLKLAKFFGGYGKTKYANARHIRERYEPERFKELVNARGPDGRRLEYTHLALLLHVDEDTADKLANQVLDSSWSIRELKAYLASKTRTTRQSTGPRVTPRPSTFLGFMENVAAHAELCLNAYDESWDEGQAIRDAFAKEPPESLDENCCARVHEATKTAREAAEHLQSIAQQLESIEKHIAGALNQRRTVGRPLKIPDDDGETVYTDPIILAGDAPEDEDE